MAIDNVTNYDGFDKDGCDIVIYDQIHLTKNVFLVYIWSSTIPDSQFPKLLEFCKC